MFRTREVFARFEPDLRDLLLLGRAQIASEELDIVVDLARQYEKHGSLALRQVLGPIRRQLEDPNERLKLGLFVEDRFTGLD
jgi:hypothetical protein